MPITEIIETKDEPCYSIEYNISGKNYTVERLKEIIQADKEDRCVILPCKLGETLYRIKKYKNNKNSKKETVFITSIELNQNNFWRIIFGGEFGTVVFRTYKEAKAKLESMPE